MNFYILGINKEKSFTHSTIWQEKLIKTLHKRASLGSVRVDSKVFTSHDPRHRIYKATMLVEFLHRNKWRKMVKNILLKMHKLQKKV